MHETLFCSKSPSTNLFPAAGAAGARQAKEMRVEEKKKKKKSIAAAAAVDNNDSSHSFIPRSSSS